MLACPGVVVTFVVPAKAAAVVAEVTMTSRWIVESAVKKVMSDLLSWVLSSSGCCVGLAVVLVGFVLVGLLNMICSVRGRCPVVSYMRLARVSRNALCLRMR